MQRSWDKDKLIRVNMTEQTVAVEPFPDEWKLLGGRALSAKILLRDCDPTCDPLGPGNVLTLLPGVLSGTAAPTSGRLSVGCKSPLTGGIKEASAGGEPAQDLMKLGYRGIIVTGQPADRSKLWGLEVDVNNVRLIAADSYRGMLNYAMCARLLGNYSSDASVISIGPAGEMLLSGASVACTDRSKDRRPARHAARGGVGAVMGSKCLKWVVVDAGKAPVRQPADRPGFAKFAKAFSNDYLTKGRHETFKWGTSAVVPIANMLNTFPYRNRTEGQNPHFEGLDGARIRESFATRGGEMHACMNGCIVRCSNVVHDAKGDYLTSALEFETLTLLGSCCDINSWEDVAELDRLCDELGVDTIETGAAIAVLMDSGGIAWGDAERVKKLLRDDVRQGTELGRLIGSGARAVGKARNHPRVPVSKGQAIPAWDPRSMKVVGVTYATSAQGADHTAGLVVDPVISGRDAVIKSQEVQIVNATSDSSGMCTFLAVSLDELRAFYGHFYGIEVSRETIADIGWNCLADEWEFNDHAGFTAADDVLPACMVEEGIGPEHSIKFDIAPELTALAKVRQQHGESLYRGGAAG